METTNPTDKKKQRTTGSQVKPVDTNQMSTFSLIGSEDSIPHLWSSTSQAAGSKEYLVELAEDKSL